MNLFTCDSCSKSFTAKRNLVRHERSLHCENETNKFSCNYCKYSAKRLDTLKYHVKKVHQTESKRSDKKVYCPLCAYNCCTYHQMIEHFRLEHDVNVISETVHFSNKEEFYEWKSNMEKVEETSFITSRGERIKKSCTALYFSCFRNGFFKSKSKNQRRQKLKGSNKISGLCPAKIDVSVFPNGEVEALFYKTHVGHSNEIGRLRLSKKVKDEIKIKLENNVKMNDILDSIRSSAVSNKMDRKLLTSKKDLYNIARKCKVKIPCDQVTQDVNYRNCVEEIPVSENDVVLFHKPQGTLSELHKSINLEENDFILIIMTGAQIELLKEFGNSFVCIDSTNCVHENRFELTTLLIFDDNHQSYPCAYMFSNRTNHTVIQIFVSSLRDAVGTRFSPSVFMADKAEQYYSSWVSVMGEPGSNLFSPWCVDGAWRQNLNMIKGVDLQVEAYQIVRTLMEETNPKTFEIMLVEALRVFKENLNTADFGKYFEDEYASTVESWAYCYRQHRWLNTNMYVEQMHSVIKKIHVRGLKPSSLNESIQSLIKFSRDKLFDNLIKLNRGKLTPKMVAIRHCHKNSKELVVEVFAEENSWKIIPLPDKGEIYEVKKVVLQDECKCELRCPDCEICVHEYICTCPDSSAKSNICVHIHYLIKFINTEQSSLENIYSDDDYDKEMFIEEKQQQDDRPIITLKTVEEPSVINKNVELQEACLRTLKSILEDVGSNEESLILIRKTLEHLHSTIQVQNSTAICEQPSMVSSIKHGLPSPHKKLKTFPLQRKLSTPQRKCRSARKPRKAVLSAVSHSIPERDLTSVNQLTRNSNNLSVVQ